MKAETRLAPGSCIGIIGGGQLGRMLSMAAAKLGFHTHIFSPEEDPPAAEVSRFHMKAEYDDPDALVRFVQDVDVVTYEFENIPAEPLKILSAQHILFPSAEVLAITQDRLEEKRFLQGLGVPVAPFASVDSVEDLRNALQVTGLPAMLKTRRFGYDGKGQVKISKADDPEDVYRQFAGGPAILEAFIQFECELSIVMARSQSGEIQAYDVSRNHHVNQILHTSTVPANISDDVAAEAYRIARVFAKATDYVGVFAVEFFYCGANAPDPLVVNEIAPRVHNTGHWTMDACAVSQFENHIRCIAGWSPGSTARHSDAEMTNLIGEDVSRWTELMESPGASIHLYGKKEARAGRKMGHINKLIKRS